jgi:hypothetical protein
MPQLAQPRERRDELSPVGKRRQISLVDPRHLVDGEGRSPHTVVARMTENAVMCWEDFPIRGLD